MRPPLAPLALACLCSCGGGAADPALAGGGSAVLITLDTTNPTALDVYGRPRGFSVTPNLDRLAGEAVVYDRARTVAPLTVVAHASMLTGLYPPRHTVRDNGHLPLPASAETIAERAHAAGLRTAAFVSAVVVGSRYGLDQGFDTFAEPEEESASLAGGVAEIGSERVTDDALDWLVGRRGGEPFFLWVHYFDPHAPYSPPPEHLARTAGRPYLGEVSAMDAAVGRLLEALRREPDWEDMLVVVVADHGEGLGRHDETSHSLLVYDTTMRVPLLVRAPGRGGGGGGRAGQRSDAIVSVVDVYPTLLQGLGLDPASDVDGLSLLGPDAVPSDRGVYLEGFSGYLNYGWSPLAGWVDASGKYLHGTRPEFYDLDRDAGEERNLFAPGDPRVERAREAIAGVARRSVLPRREAEARALAGAEDLRSLGYAGAASSEAQLPGPLADTGLPAPRTRMAEHRSVQAALARIGRGDLEGGIAGLEQVVAANPRNAFALELLGKYLIDAGRPEDALEPMGAMVALGLDRPRLRQHLAVAHARLGHFDQALGHLDRAETLSPGYPRTQGIREWILEIERQAREGDGPDPDRQDGDR